jgi:hypothetical protein
VPDTVGAVPTSSERRLRRLAEELDEEGVTVDGHVAPELLLEEVDRALRPVVHEGRVASGGSILDPRTEPETWVATELEITRVPLNDYPLSAARRFTDGLSSWLLRRNEGDADWVVFDRPAGSERDLVVLASVAEATIVQRHPSGTVRIVDAGGVARWNGRTWRREPPVSTWLDLVHAGSSEKDVPMLRALLEFAVHDLGAKGIGALLVYRVSDETGPPVEERLPRPPPLRIDRATHLAPLRHAVAQVDGATVFDSTGALRQLGVLLAPTGVSESTVEPFKGTRHTAGRRYSYDDPDSVVIAVSEDGPVSVFRNGEVLGRSPDGADGSRRAVGTGGLPPGT